MTLGKCVSESGLSEEDAWVLIVSIVSTISDVLPSEDLV